MDAETSAAFHAQLVVLPVPVLYRLAISYGYSTITYGTANPTIHEYVKELYDGLGHTALASVIVARRNAIMKKNAAPANDAGNVPQRAT